VLCGLDGLGLRTLEELLNLGERVVVIDNSQTSQYASRARSQGVHIVYGDNRDEAVLREAGVESARSIVLVHDDDVGNLHAALAAHDINPHIRVVLRMFNVELGKRIEQLFHDGAVLSSSAIAAPAFVAAALHTQVAQEIEVAGHTLAVMNSPGHEASVLLPLARVHKGGSTELFPEDSHEALCLVSVERSPLAVPKAAPSKFSLKSITAPVGAVWSTMIQADRRFRYVLATITLLAFLSTLIFYFFYNLTLSDALYFTLTIITTTGFGDISLRNAPLPVKMYGTLLMVLGAASLTLFYALITDAIVSARLARALGAARVRMQDHIVVCGLGNIGYRVVERIAALGIPVAAVELHENGRFVPTVRRLGVPVLIADSRVPETLRALSVDKARCIIVATDDDVANLEAALHARALKPNLRVVLRLFEPDLAARVEKTFNISISRSVSALAAPAFAAAAIGRQVIGTIPAGTAILMVARSHVGQGSACAGKTVADFEYEMEGRVLFLGGEGRITRPALQATLEPGQELILIATRQGLSDMVET